MKTRRNKLFESERSVLVIRIQVLLTLYETKQFKISSQTCIFSLINTVLICGVIQYINLQYIASFGWEIKLIFSFEKKTFKASIKLNSIFF